MFRNTKLVVWALALSLFALAPKQASASCTWDYLLCLNDASQYGGGAAGTVAEIECGAEWFGCVYRNITTE